MAFRMRWPTRQSIIIQGFGQNPSFYQKFGLPGHEGLDFVAAQGDEVCAVADGCVSDVRLDAFADPLTKPYGNQVRVQHADGYETLYAHLSHVTVVRGQLVAAGQLIGLAGDTGYTDTPHLHLSLKRHGATVNGETDYPYDLIDPEPYLIGRGDSVVPDLDPPVPSVRVAVVSREAGFANVHALPHEGSDLVTRVDHEAPLDALESAYVVRHKAGREGQWLWVRTPTGQIGWVAAQYVEVIEAEAPDPPETLANVTFVVVNTRDDNLILRAGPGTDCEELARFPHGTTLRALEDGETVEAKVGTRGAWLHVQAPTAQIGYCAAWYLKLKPFTGKPVIPAPPVGEPTSYVVVESPDLGLRLRAGPGREHERIWWMPHKTVLESLEDPFVTGGRLGRRGEWLHVRTPALQEGYAAAWYLSRPPAQDRREPADPAQATIGLSPHIFGIHAISVADDPHIRDRIRGLFETAGKKGWILFTEICGRHPRAIREIPEIRQRLWDWADAGYGVIIRLNHGYEPGGTLPESRLYDDYAAAAARWVEVYLRDDDRSFQDYVWTIQIGNEQNNPREHPGGFEHPTEHITPERYADAFNGAYERIKDVLPNAIVCPGAVDPYNYMPMALLGGTRWRPLDYFTTMMRHIEALDGVILHAYTHGPDPDRVAHLKRFGDGTGPLWDHYYDFQTYRVFMERIPARWRDVPVYITEMNHIHRPAGEHDQGWLDRNLGWVRAVYAEINRWNQTPYAQQIHCGLLYRWIGDAWAIENKPEVLADFVQALQNDYRWRSTTASDPYSYSLAGSASDGPSPQRLDERYIIQPDDLTRIAGIGERAQSALRAAGILIFEQLASMDPAELAAVVEETGLRTQHLATWPEQARLAVEGDWDGLDEYRLRLS
ncbi:MAG: peptidoglycan DD-metalloendopeptidase family protein [Anaerolineae bacterium]